MTTFLWILAAGIAMTGIALVGSVALLLSEERLKGTPARVARLIREHARREESSPKERKFAAIGRRLRPSFGTPPHRSARKRPGP